MRYKSAFQQAITIVMACFFLSGCASIIEDIVDDRVPVEYSFNATKFILPEANGRFLHGRLGLQAVGAGTVTLIDDIDSNSYSESPSIKTNNTYGGLFDLGLLSRLDVFFASGVGGRVQVLGAPRSQAKKGDVSLSLAYMSRSFESKIDSEDTTGSIKKAEAKTKSTGDEYLLIAGRRLSDNLLLYGGGFYAKSEVRVHLMQTNNTNFTTSGYPTKGEGESYGANLGLSYESPDAFFSVLGWSFGVEVACSRTTWEKTDAPTEKADPKTGASIGAMAALIW